MPLPVTRTSMAAMIAVSAWGAETGHAADVPATSRIDAVTVFPSGAEVTRLASVRLQAGEHTVIIPDLPRSADPASIRVEGKAGGALRIGSVDNRRLPIAQVDNPAVNTERRQIEIEIEKLNDEKLALQAAIQAADAQKKLLTNLTDLPGKPVAVGSAPAAPPDWAQLAQLIASQTLVAQKSIIETNTKIRDVDRKLADLARRHAVLAVTPEERTEVKIHVNAAAAFDADLTVRYQVPNAAWTPQYDARLATGNKTTAAKMQLVRLAGIQQRTGEAWDNVAVTLSTTRPAAGSQAPELRPWLVDILEPPPPPAPRAAMQESVARDELSARKLAAAPVMAGAADATANRARQDAAPISATIDANAFQALYVIGGRNTILPTGETKRVQIDQTDIDPTLSVRSVPKRDPRAFLYAKSLAPKTTTILPGSVALFRDGTFVGTGRLPQLAAGEEFELGFGQDDNVRIRYSVIDEKRSESGILSTSKAEAKSYRIAVKSLHERAIPVSIIDQVPVSLNQDVKVEFTTKTPVTVRKDLEDKRGIVAWDFNLNPDEERILEFGHRMSWPASKQMVTR